ncbi:Kinesin-related motor protein [Blumeria hordei DH14]|uniref:Kinesin-related motor protein n=1 Tax=Blumeria graminis f. sp. hordei (strain DH14) TaxID=546991 RepID=N1JI22_BLUG1|nr:Kinesin-related motor protein [Blumeria hordei DH14]
MAGNSRPSCTRKVIMRPPSRPSSSHRYEPSGSTTIMEPSSSVAAICSGVKRKERDFEIDDESTNINVVVRCRGRNEREVRENSGVVLSTEGVKGKTLELGMGPNALSNKTYHFDKVFSSAADQAMIYDDVVTPILDEMLSGYNCTIFAYGQTGTGKTYTMSGDMNETCGILSDSAGLIPRALQALFTNLEMNDSEWSVKCSFIELYNEELRDLISPEDNVKLKIYDDNNNKKGQSSTIVQGMDETHIKSAAEGIRLLQAGSHKRQVAATKCNDLSSRGHTIFTVTAYVKRTADSGEDYISAGKLNLVDLAGSENIQRSGAENKRAAEAGLINKSLLTLGRVINALVDKSSHIPYRESKLTRLLQDSLGGRTKTCIIATVSPAKSNLEETISTLDYAFRAKNIRNKPQINQMINKKTLLKEFTVEIEKLKTELIATRQRNGVYLSNENYEEITTQSESRRILSEEQAAKIETMEMNLRNKVQELYSLTTSFMSLKKDNESTKTLLDETNTLLEQTEIVLATTRQSLTDESKIRKAHQLTEQRLSKIGSKLISTLTQTVEDIGGLHAKNGRKAGQEFLNQNTWCFAQAEVSEVTNLVESKTEELGIRHQDLIERMSTSMQSFISNELLNLSANQFQLQKNVATVRSSEKEMLKKTESSTEQMNGVLDEVDNMRLNASNHIHEGFHDLSITAERISNEVAKQLCGFHTQLQDSYISLGKNFSSIFENILQNMKQLTVEASSLRSSLESANELVTETSHAASLMLENILQEERDQASADRQKLLDKITELITVQSESQESRLTTKIREVQREMETSKEIFDTEKLKCEQNIDAWSHKERNLQEEIVLSREILKNKIDREWAVADDQSARLQNTAKSVHEETIRNVDAQLKDIENQMYALGDFVTRARSMNKEHHDYHVNSLQDLANNVQTSNSSVNGHMISSYERSRDMVLALTEQTFLAQQCLEPLDSSVNKPLSQLRKTINSLQLRQYQPTGQTPQKTHYDYPTKLPRTDDYKSLLASVESSDEYFDFVTSPVPGNNRIFEDLPCLNEEFQEPQTQNSKRLQESHIHRPSSISKPGLREIDSNISNPTFSIRNLNDQLTTIPKSKRLVRRNGTAKDLGKLPVLMARKTIAVSEESENLPPNESILALQGTGRRRSRRIAY